MPPFLTVKDAAKLVNKSPSAIRRIIYPIVKDDQHPDRHHIQPSPAKVRELRIQGENFPWKISEKLLRREVPEGSAKEGTDPKGSAGPTESDAAIIDLLRRELEINRQIETQNELLKGLSERLREENILIGSLHKQLSLTAGTGHSAGAMDIITQQGSEKGSDRSATDKPNRTTTVTDAPWEGKPKEQSQSSTPPKKKHWLFRKIF